MTTTSETSGGGRVSEIEIAVLRVALTGIEPPVWRRAAVPAATDLETLHVIIQAAWAGTMTICGS